MKVHRKLHCALVYTAAADNRKIFEIQSRESSSNQ
jgi:hypothetical protein